ncbi:MAG: Zn-ribbon domain-containing OB-fold protein [Janthinobacterium lividum]
MQTTAPPDLSAPFWDGVARRQLLLQYDRTSGQAQFYPRPVSLQGNGDVEWRPSSGFGTLLAVTLNRVAPPAFGETAPFLIGLIRLDEGPRMLARLDGSAASLRAGTRVEICWHDAAPPQAPFRFKAYTPGTG